MDVQQLSVWLPADRPADAIDLEAFIPIFHAWIRDHRLGDQVLIDVADYRHVHDGPGVMLIGHDGVWSVGRAGGRLGLSYARKRDPIGDAAARLEEAFREALGAALALEGESALAGRLRFRTDEVQVRILSRLVATNTPEIFAAFEPTIRTFLNRLYGDAEFTIERADDDPRAPFGVDVRIAGAPPAVTLLSRLA